MHGRQRPKELDRKTKGLGRRTWPPRPRHLLHWAPATVNSLSDYDTGLWDSHDRMLYKYMYNKVCFMHLFASLVQQSKPRPAEIGTNGPFVLEIFTERESAFTTENLRMQTRPHAWHIAGLKKVPIHSRFLKRGTLTVVAERPPRKL